MAKGQKGGSIVEALYTGTAFFAASKAGTFTQFLKKFAVYALVVTLILVAVGMVAKVLFGEHFTVPVTPSKEGTEKLVTPAGNVIMY